MVVKNEKNLGEGSVGKLLVQLALPAIAAQLINLLYNLVDRMYIGRIPEIGASALTGVGVSLPVILVISAFAALVGSGGAPRAAIMMGRGDKETAEKILGNCVSALVILSVILTIIILLFSHPILMAFGASEETITYAQDYMQIYAIGTIGVQIALGLNPFITTQGFSTMGMLTVSIGAVLNIILDPIFIFGFNMGVKGAAIATVISQAVSAIWVVRFLMSKKSGLRIKKQYLAIDFKILGPVIALGISPFIMQATESLIAVTFNTSLLKYGSDLAVGAMTILSSVMQFAMLPIIGLTQGAQPIISFNFGARNPDRVKKAFYLLLISSTVYTFTLWGSVMLFPTAFAKIFTNSEELIELSAWAIRIYMATAFVFGVQLSCQQTFIALGKAKESIFLALLRKIILLIPLIYILPHVFPGDKVMAVFLAEPVADTIAVIATATLFFIQFKKIREEMV